MIFAEILLSNWQNKHYYKASDSLCTAGLLAGNIAMAFAIKGFALAFHFYLYQFRLIDLTNLIPTWAMWAITFVMIDFVFYIYHRMSHRVRFLWAIHMSHHSSEEMNFAVSFRQAWFGPVSKIPFFMVLPLLGLDPTIIAVAGVISTLWGIVGHTQIFGKLGPLEWIFYTRHLITESTMALTNNTSIRIMAIFLLSGTESLEHLKVSKSLVNIWLSQQC